jgi:hypothetical protein
MVIWIIIGVAFGLMALRIASDVRANAHRHSPLGGWWHHQTGDQSRWSPNAWADATERSLNNSRSRRQAR